MYHNRRHCNPELFTLPKPQPRPPRDLFERTVSSSIGPAVLGTQRKLALIATEQGVIFPENLRPQALHSKAVIATQGTLSKAGRRSPCISWCA